MIFIISRRRPAGVLHFSWGRLIAPGTWPFLKSLDSRTSMIATSSPFSIWWLTSMGPVVKAILSAKNCFALAALLLIVLVMTISSCYSWVSLFMLWFSLLHHNPAGITCRPATVYAFSVTISFLD